MTKMVFVFFFTVVRVKKGFESSNLGNVQRARRVSAS